MIYTLVASQVGTLKDIHSRKKVVTLLPAITATPEAMGSSFSLFNDTDRVVWVQQGTQWTVVMGDLGGLGALATFGAFGLGAVAAGAGSTALIGTLEGIVVGEVAIAGTALGLTAAGWGAVGAVVTLSSAALATTLGITIEEAEKLKQEVQKFIDESTELKPGETFTFSGTLSLVRSVTAMNNRFQMQKRDCWTGPTDGSNYEYKISEHFSNLIQELPKK